MIKISEPFLAREEIDAVINVLKSGNLTQGENVEKFENEFARYIGVKYAVATSSGTTALYTALLSAGIRPKDEIITTPFSFIATANSILHCGAKPIFSDIDEKTFNIDPEKIKEKLTDKTKAILPVHLYGQSADMDYISKISEDYNLVIIEDACQAIGAEYKGRKVGSFSDAAVFSFYPTKNITTSEGGIIVTDNKQIADKAKIIRNHGLNNGKYDVLGFNYRMTEIEAAIGIEQLKKLEKFNEKRILNANILTEEIADLVETPFVPENSKHVFSQYTIKTNERDKIHNYFRKFGIETKIFYPTPIHKHSLYKNLGHKDLSVSENISKLVLSLPVHPKLREDDIKMIAETLRNYFNSSS